MTHRARAAAAVACLSLLTGCAQLPQPRPLPAPERAQPVVEPEQAARIADSLVETVATAERAGDPALLRPRVAGPELALRSARHTLTRAGVPASPTYAADELQPLSAFIPRQEGWPRWMVTVTQPGPDQLPSLLLLRSDSPREPYRLWGSPSLLPGTSLPAARVPAEGVEALDVDEPSGLAAAPAEVASRYADVLLQGAASPFAPDFAEDSFRSGPAAASAQDAAAVRAVGGTYTETRTVVPDSVVAARTDDGGALVMAAYEWVTSFSVPSPSDPGRLTPELAALAGRETAREVVRTSAEVVAFHVPPAGSGPVRVVAGERGPVSVQAS